MEDAQVRFTCPKCGPSAETFASRVGVRRFKHEVEIICLGCYETVTMVGVPVEYMQELIALGAFRIID